MTYPEAIQYLESFINYEKILNWSYKESLKLERIREFLTTINNPQDSLKCIHIAGTKGKGSTCAFIAYMLKEAGYKVGLYTSPHLSDFRERIRILYPQKLNAKDDRHPISFAPGTRTASHQVQDCFEGMIPKSELTKLVERLKPVIERYNRDSKYGPLSFFEVYTALGFVYFKEKNVDFVVLETGLGGRLDATNVVEPIVCAITPISYEHTQQLGSTLSEIAAEKAGIIKGHQLIVISAPQEKEAQEVIRQKCREVGAKLYEVSKDIFCEKMRQGFNVLGIFGEYPNIETRLLGSHQLINAAVAVGLIEALRFHDIIIDSNSVREGLYNTLWPGRCEVISRGPLVVLDGAQNIASARVLKETIKENFQYKRLILVLGISKDKDIKGVCNELNDLPDEIILTQANNPRAREPQSLASFFNKRKIHLTSNIKEAKEKIKVLAEKDDLVLVTGSLFVVGEFRNGGL